MGCCGGDREPKHVTAAQKWDYINLSDFTSTSCFTPLSYGFLIIMLIVSVACYIVDAFTAYNLIFFDKWSGQVQPVHLDITRWVFMGCILLSWVLLVLRYMSAIRAIKSGGIAKSYLDPLAVRIQSLRMGKNGRGWRRFLVFAELTKSKQGSEYVALFTYFSFEAWLRILFAEGPRNVINALTLYTVMQAKLIPKDSTTVTHGHTPIVQFFVNLQILAESNHLQAAIMFGMLFTLIIWVISFLSLAIAVILYIMFLWHHIPSQDGGLRGFLKRKIDKALQKIVDAKIKKAFAKENMNRSRDELKAGGSTDALHDFTRQPTLPLLNDDKLPDMPMLTRQNTQSTLPLYALQPPGRSESPIPGLQRQPTFPDMDGPPGMPSRTNTLSSSTSYGSNAALMGSAASMGYGAPGRNYPPLPLSRMGSQATMMSDDRSGMNRSVAGSIQGSERSYTPGGGPQRPYTPSGPQRPYTPGGSQRPYTPNGGPPLGPGRPMGPPTRQDTGMSVASNGSRPGAPPMAADTPMGDVPSGRFASGGSQRSNAGHGDYLPYRGNTASPASTYGRNSPGPSRQLPAQEFEMRSQTPQSTAPRSDTPSRFQAYNPNNAAAAAGGAAPVRNFTAPTRPMGSDALNPQPQRPPPQRSGTAPIPPSARHNDSIYDSYGATSPSLPGRAATASPGAQRGGYGPVAF